MQVDPNTISVCGLCSALPHAFGLQALPCWLDCVLLIGVPVIVALLWKRVNGLFR